MNENKFIDLQIDPDFLEVKKNFRPQSAIDFDNAVRINRRYLIYFLVNIFELSCYFRKRFKPRKSESEYNSSALTDKNFNIFTSNRAYELSQNGKYFYNY